jgi:hypothetical protein
MKHRVFAGLLLALASGACQITHRVPGVVIETEPPGARVLVDGRDSGYVTPCNLGLPRERTRLDLVLPGYRVARIDLRPDSQSYSMRTIDMYSDYKTWYFPLWLNFEDFVFPFKKEQWSSPARIHVPMRLSID